MVDFRDVFVASITMVLIPLVLMPAAGAQIPAERIVAEWEPALGTMIRWPLGIPSSLVVALADNELLYVLVENSSQETQARNTFIGWGISIAHIEFVYTDTYSHWTRDYGPQFLISETGWKVINQIFNGYPEENGCTVCNAGMTRYDCLGTMFCNDRPIYDMYDCIVDDGTCEDINGDGVITDWLGDGYCDDGTYNLNFRCDNYGWDCGDCGDPIVDPNGYCDPEEKKLPRIPLRLEGAAHISRPEPVFSGFSPADSAEHRRGWGEDDDTNIDFAYHMGWEVLDVPLYFTGGNMMTDGYGTGVSTAVMIHENGMTAGEFAAIAQQTMGFSTYHILDNPNIESIQHIDCNAKFLDAETVMVKELDPANPEYACLEALADTFTGMQTWAGRPFRVCRVFCPAIDGPSWETYPTAAYTNSLILNGRIYVPQYGIAGDAGAIQAYQDALPGYEVLGFAYENWYGEDALHCRTMGIFDPQMLHIQHAALRDEDAAPGVTLPVMITVMDYSLSGIVEGSVLLKWRYSDESEWQTVPFEETRDAAVYTADLPPLNENTTVHYCIAADSNAGRTGKHPGAGWHVFNVGSGSSPTPTPACLHTGDVDGSGVLTAGDAQTAFQIVLGVYIPTYTEACAADCNAGGDVTAGDAQAIFQVVLGLLPECADPV